MRKETVLNKNFFERNTLDAAKELLGCVMVRQLGNVIKKGMIVETEAYTQDDPACHAYKGKTKRASVLFKEPGISYVYFIYGMYHCVNVVTEKYDTAGAILIRALEPLLNLENTNGPGKLCREMEITKEHNEINLCDKDSPIYIIKGKHIPHSQIIQTERIGIKQAAEYPWRFYIKDNPYVSKK